MPVYLLINNRFLSLFKYIFSRPIKQIMFYSAAILHKTAGHLCFNPDNAGVFLYF